MLEYATPRAGEFVPVTGKSFGLGVMNPRTSATETPEGIVARVEEVLAVVAPERMFLNPDCGFGTFASRAMNRPEIAQRKLAAMVDAAATLRQRHSRAASAAPTSRRGAASSR